MLKGDDSGLDTEALAVTMTFHDGPGLMPPLASNLMQQPLLTASLGPVEEGVTGNKVKKIRDNIHQTMPFKGPGKRGRKKKEEPVEENVTLAGGVSSRGRERKPKSFAFSDEQAQFAYSLNASNSQRYQKRIKGDEYDDGDVIYFKNSESQPAPEGTEISNGDAGAHDVEGMRVPNGDDTAAAAAAAAAAAVAGTAVAAQQAAQALEDESDDEEEDD